MLTTSSLIFALNKEQQYTVPYTPQQNGVAEWKNHTLKEMANV